MNNYPAFELLHTEDDIKEATVDIIQEHMSDLDDKYDAGDIASCKDLIEAVRNDSYIDTFTAEFLHDILSKHMEQYIIEAVGTLEPRNLHDILIYAEIHKAYIDGR